MKSFFTATLLASSLFMAQTSHANETVTPEYQPRCNQGVYDLCGYYNRATFKRGEPLDWLILPQFEAAFPFNDGLAAVKLDGKFGFIDQTGKFKIKPKYESVGLFYKGLAPFKEDGQIGFIDKKGNIVVPAKFSFAIAINKMTIIGSDDSDYKNTSSKLLPSLSDNNIITTPLSRWVSGLYNVKKGWLTDQKYYFEGFNDKKHDLLWAKERRGKTGLMRSDGRWLKDPNYVRTQPLREGLAVVTVEQDDGTKLSGAVNKKGKVVIPPKFERLGNWDGGLATVTVKQEDGAKLSGAVDKKGEVIIPIKYDWLGNWMGDYARTRLGDYNSKKNGLVDREGNLLGGRYFEEIQLPDLYFTATETVFLPRVKADGIWHSLTLDGKLIADQKKADEIARGSILSCENFKIIRTEYGLRAQDKAGKTIVDFEYPEYFRFFIEPQSVNFAFRCDAPLSISQKGKYSFLLPDGTFFAGQFFENMRPIFENVAGFSVNKKWGLIDSSGKVIVEPTYDNIRWYGDERFLLTTGETSYLFDKNGTRYNLADDPNYNQEFKVKIPPRENYLYCPASNLKFKDGKWGLVSIEGETILPFKYNALLCYEKGLAWAPRDDLKKWCPINRRGEFLSEDTCQTTKYPRHRWHYYPKKLADDDYESSLLWNLQYLNYGDGRASAPPFLSPDGVSAHKPILMGPRHARK